MDVVVDEAAMRGFPVHVVGRVEFTGVGAQQVVAGVAAPRVFGEQAGPGQFGERRPCQRGRDARQAGSGGD
jgi:hypothetical protein